MEKARSLDSDVIIIDLEDSVEPSEKDKARKSAMSLISSGIIERQEVAIRINALSTPWGHTDLEEAVHNGANIIVVPKISAPKDLIPVRSAISDSSDIDIWAMLETPAAMIRALDIAEARMRILPQLSLFIIGTNDLAKDTRAILKPGRASYLPWLMNCIAAARAVGIDILDGVFNDFKDTDGFAEECLQGREIGMNGKTLIHPGQIGIANDYFTPTDAEVEWAVKVCETFSNPIYSNAGVISIEGKMVERLHADMARRILEISDACRMRSRV